MGGSIHALALWTKRLLAELVSARNNSLRQTVLNLRLAKAYLAGTDSAISMRT